MFSAQSVMVGTPLTRGASPASTSAAPRRVTCMASNAKFFVGGNWKCNGTKDSVMQLVSDLNNSGCPEGIDVVVAPPFVHLDLVQSSLMMPYNIAGQNCWTGAGGAFTGEVSAEMLKDMGVPWVILGHSERRALCGESSEIVGDKCKYALSKGLAVIACIGETLQEREAGNLESVLDEQMSAIAEKVDDWENTVIAYEPVWAIGTGVVATPEQAQEVHAFLRKWVADKVSPEVSDTVRIIYGGSVNAGNCAELGGQEDIDGFLVGGASLSGPDFVKICNSAPSA